MEPPAAANAAVAAGNVGVDPGVPEMAVLLKKHYLEVCVPRLR